ncbi:hypothetical protein jhhlp_002003 [Lomentospora prolificans]|uniref:Lipoyl-binding domain-containing protein n=1 Tax=Lomentospora prolificans TaxID=41688 RepID=A0A2N3NCW2_9PEZI|nr:hypothetical protein jhhlp_002003 [Lomentospora prolificans]
MASIASACRLSARVVRSRVVSETTFRGYQTSSRCLAASNFTMPALSPTMTEGNIANWKVKEGDSYSAGDVLLEIETDKATMDVEAQDDGILMKIMQGDGSKSVQVGTRIAVMAEPGDDLATLEIPADEKSAASEQPKAQEESKPAKQESQSEEKKATPRPTTGKVHKQKYPLYPSVHALIKQHNIDESVVNQITPTGPNGRLLKGDVLAYLGTINANTPAQLSSMFEKLAHLDLSNIKVAPKKEGPKAEKPVAEAPKAPEKADISVPISMSRVLEIQQKIHGSVGTFLPISTFISRATDVANDELPPAARKPTADELFNDVLGIKNPRAEGTRGAYHPKIQALREAGFAAQKAASKPTDIIDILAGSSKKARPTPSLATPGLSTGTNIFSLTVPKAEEKRATVFLEKVKLILENEPGRLVL